MHLTAEMAAGVLFPAHFPLNGRLTTFQEVSSGCVLPKVPKTRTVHPATLREETAGCTLALCL